MRFYKFFFYPFVFQLHVFHKRVFFSMLIRVYRLDLRQRVFFFPKLSYDDLHFFDENQSILLITFQHKHRRFQRFCEYFHKNSLVWIDHVDDESVETSLY